MVFSVSSLRQWLQETPDLVLSLFRHVEKAHGPAALQYGGGPAATKLRKTAGVRMWVTRAPERLLLNICGCGMVIAESRLCELGYKDQIQDPDLEQLTHMLKELPPDLAQLMLHGLSLFSNAPAHRFAHSHADELLEAALSDAAPLTEADYERLSCANRVQEDGGEATRPEPDGNTAISKEEERDEVVAEPDADGIELEIVRLNEAGAALAGRLDSFATTVRDGRLADDQELLHDTVSWVRERRALARAFAVAGTEEGWGDDQDWSAAQRLVEQLREEQRRQQETDQKIRETEQALDEVRTMFDMVTNDLVRESLRGQITEFEQRLRDLCGNTPATVAVRSADVKVGARGGGTETGSQSEPESDPEPQPVVDRVEGAPETPRPEAAHEPGAESPSVTAVETGPVLQEEVSGPVTRTEPEETPDGRQEREAARAEESVSSGDTVTTARTGEPAPPQEASRPEVTEPAEPSTGAPAEKALPAAHTPAAVPVPRRSADPQRTTADEPSAPTVPAASDVWAGAPSPVEVLVAEGRLAEAYWLSRAADAPAHRTLVLAFVDAAFHTSLAKASDLQVQAEELLEALDEGHPWDDDRDAYLVLLTAAIRSGLSARWASSFLTAFTSMPGVPEPWASVMSELVHAVRQSTEIQPGDLGKPAATPVTDRREEIGDRARQLALDLPLRTIKLQRGTIVLQTLAAPDGQLGRTLKLIQGWAEGRIEAEELAKEMEEHYKRSDAADRIIDTTDRAKRTPKQSKNDIHSAAREQLRTHIKTVRDLLTTALRIALSPRPSGGRDIGRDLMRAIADARQAEPLPGVGGTLLALLLRWLDGAYAPEPRDTGFRPPAEGLLHLPGLRWHVHEEQDEPDLERPDALGALLGLLGPVAPAVALQCHRDAGDLHLADRLLERLEHGRIVGAAMSAAELAEWQQRIADAASTWGRKCAEEHRSAQLLLAQIRVQNLLKPEEEHGFTTRLLDLESDAHGDRFGERFRSIATISHDLRVLEQQQTAKLYRQLDAARLSEAEYGRIHRLLDRGKTVAAEELLSFARRGEALPAPAEPAGEELTRFLKGVAHPEAPQPTRRGVGARWWAQHYAEDKPLVQNALSGLGAWQELIGERDQRKIRGLVMSVLRLLGLTVIEANVEEARYGVTRLNVRADITESTPGYVAALGSQARRTYKVVVIADELRGEGPLRHLPESAIGANLILYLQPLGPEGRRQLALASRNRGQQALVVDPAAVGWVAARAPRSFRATQRVTLPWTGYTPYTPHVAGLVPPEVFKGRAEEMQEILRPDGSIFLFGGRQLGKSSLLRQAVEVFQKADPDRHIAVYMDLLKADIGHAEPPEGIWRALLAELKRRGVIGTNVSDRAVDVIADAVQQWIEAEPGRRVLLLADEADAFLTADAQAVYTGGGQSTFRTVKRLQRLMETTNRSFKVVFAGLHQVQRFNHLTNVVTAHGGPGILVGPLKPQAAVGLVEEPLAAVGLTFETPDLVWHILGVTNYQANLVQIFCDHLVAYMQQRAMPADGRHAPITWDDVQAVANLERVRELIAERLRYTINLEDRYRVLTLLVALRSLEHGYTHASRPSELLEAAHEIWEEGFPLNSERQLTIFLDEMVGLGLLIRVPGEERAYAMRSPNVVNMLGTRNELQSELNDTEFDLPYDYNPRAARRSIGTSGGVQRMSPLTEGQFDDILGHPTRTTLVSCTRALGDDHVERGLRLYGGGYGLDIISVGSGDNLTEAITANSRRKGSRILFVDLRGRNADQVGEAAERLVKHTGGTTHDTDATPGAPRRYAVVLCSPDTTVEAEKTGAGLVLPQRWTVDSVRAWPESPFGSPQERRGLIESTGGWPGLVETAMHNVRSGIRQKEVLQSLRELWGTPEAATAHLEAAGLTPADVSRLTTWAQFYSVEEYAAGKAAMTPGDIAAAFFDQSDNDPLEAAEHLLKRLDGLAVLDPNKPGGVRLDPVTFRALKTIGPAQ
ncbi:AAA family ATPase [Streptomyces hirsutus]|uniref:AAA family ATPase n=1 Tax=Streptomyces hirsutus TaxID=35620 RepID=UPI00367622C3